MWGYKNEGPKTSMRIVEMSMWKSEQLDVLQIYVADYTMNFEKSCSILSTDGTYVLKAIWICREMKTTQRILEMSRCVVKYINPEVFEISIMLLLVGEQSRYSRNN